MSETSQQHPITGNKRTHWVIRFSYETTDRDSRGMSASLPSVDGASVTCDVQCASLLDAVQLAALQANRAIGGSLECCDTKLVRTWEETELT